MSFPKTYTLLTTFLLLCTWRLSAQTGCPGCAIALPEGMAEDTLFLSEAPAGEVRSPYEGDISFRVPKSTDPVAAIDPTVVAGIPIQKITITNVTNLPPGLSWEVSQREFNTADETDGCIRLCGLPLEAGLYNIEVLITAQVFIITQEASFTFPLLIEPATSETAGFTMTNGEGCGELEVSFENKIPSNGRSGFSYLWDFGNGNNSIDEDPFAQYYAEPGKYPVTYQAIVDTTGFFLTNVRVVSTSCTDPFNNAPDLYVRVYDPEENVLYTSNVLTNSNPPVNFNVNIPLEEGDYVVRVFDKDDDILGGDKSCGTYAVNQLTEGELQADKGRARMTILHPVDTIEAVDTVIVYQQPDAPQIVTSSVDNLCQGDAASLLTNYSEGIQWYQDDTPIAGANQPEWTVEASGAYWVQYISPDGCIANSEPVELSFAELPPAVPFTAEKNLLAIDEEATLPQNYTLQWYLNDEAISGEDGTTYCISESGNYSLEVRDLATGCTSRYDLEATYDSRFAGCLSTGTDLEAVAQYLAIYPNPTSGMLSVSFSLEERLPVQFTVYNTLGQQLQNQDLGTQNGALQFRVDLQGRPAGIYWLRIRVGEHFRGYRVIKE